MNLLELINDKIDDNHEHTQQRLSSIDANLAEHMRRTDVLEQLHRDNQERIQRLEEPKKAISMLIKWTITAGSVAGAVFAISRFL